MWMGRVSLNSEQTEMTAGLSAAFTSLSFIAHYTGQRNGLYLGTICAIS